jgi:hypothetical protein
MGWKEVLKVFIGIFLFASLLTFVFSIGFFQITSYNRLEPTVHALVEQDIVKQFKNSIDGGWNSEKQELIKNCTGKNETLLSIFSVVDKLDLVDIGLPTAFIINCNGIEQITIEEITDIASKQVFDEVYYRNYPYNFIQCLTEKNSFEGKPLLFASKKANNFFATVSFISIIATLLFIMLIFVLSQPRHASLYTFAPIFLVAGLPFLGFLAIKTKIVDILGQFSEVVSPMIDTFLIDFSVVFFLGLVFLILAIIFAILYKEDNENVEEKEVNYKKKMKKTDKRR